MNGIEVVSVICPFCKRDGKKSKVFPGGSSQTLMMYTEFYDEEGNHHFHNPNWTTTNYSCSNGHHWVNQTRSKCFCEGGGVEEKITRNFRRESAEANTEVKPPDSVEVSGEYVKYE